MPRCARSLHTLLVRKCTCDEVWARLVWAMRWRWRQSQEKALLVGHLNTIIREVTRNKEARLRELEQKLLDSPVAPVLPAGVPAEARVDTREVFEGFQ
jgi:hypothetical protein